MPRVIIIPVDDKDRWTSLLGDDYGGTVKDGDGDTFVYASFNDFYIPEIQSLRNEDTVVIEANLTDNRPVAATLAAGYTFPPAPPFPGDPEED